MQKFNTFLFLFLISTLTIFAQEDGKENQLLSNASYVFKGKVKSYKGFKNDNKPYLSYIIDIDSIYRGDKDLKLGFIELITPLPKEYTLMEDGSLLRGDPFLCNYNRYAHFMHIYSFSLSRGESGVFVCNKSFEKSITKQVLNNKITVSSICETRNCYYRFVTGQKIDKATDKAIGEYKVRGLDQMFDEVSDFNAYMKKNNLAPLVKKKDTAKIKLLIEKKKPTEN